VYVRNGGDADPGLRARGALHPGYESVMLTRRRK
jgi:hypothetical protein